LPAGAPRRRPWQNRSADRTSGADDAAGHPGRRGPVAGGVPPGFVARSRRAQHREIEQAVAAVVIEGGRVTPATIALLEQMADGSLTEDEAIESLLRTYRRTSRPAA
jgi:hypothetical protein